MLIDLTTAVDRQSRSITAMALGNNIRRLRKAKGWEQKDLAAASGVGVGTISAMEVRNARRSEYAPQLARALGIPTDDLYDDDAVTAVITQSMHPNTIDVQAIDVTDRRALPAPTTVTLAQALAVLGGALAPLDATARRRAGTLLADLADDPASHASLADILAMVIESGKRRAA